MERIDVTLPGTDIVEAFFLPEKCHPQDRKVVGWVIESDEYKLLQLYRSGFMPKVIVDCGAHYGSFGFLASRIWPEASIYAFEPNWASFSVLVKNCPGNVLNSCSFLTEVVSEGRWETLVGVDEEGFPASSVYGKSVDTRDTKPKTRAVARQQKLSYFLKESDIKCVDLLKIDTEGSEVPILSDLNNTKWLGRIRYIRGEWHGLRAVGEVYNLLRATHSVFIHNDPEQINGSFFACHRFLGVDAFEQIRSYW